MLASTSPRRAQLLGQLGLPFRTVNPDIDEQPSARETVAAYVERVTRAKHQAGCELAAMPAVVIAADTEVELNGRIYGKPRDAADACAMLASLAGRTHRVLTGLAVGVTADQCAFHLDVSQVSFAELSAAQIERYVATGESLDKAGAYGVQGLAAGFITRLEGSFFGVMGMPLAPLAALLACHQLGPLAP